MTVRTKLSVLWAALGLALVGISAGWAQDALTVINQRQELMKTQGRATAAIKAFVEGKGRWCTDAGEPTVLVSPGPWGQGARMETGFATRIMRLSTSVAMAVSPCWAGKMRARSFGPMIAL